MQHILLLQKIVGRRLTPLVMIGAILLVLVPQNAAASAWDPTLLVNTEAFQIIDDGDGASNIFLQFGDDAGETLTWDRLGSDFEFSDDLTVDGNLAVTGSASASGSITLNDDNSGDATLNFGGSVVETLTFNATLGRFEFSDDVHVTGNITSSGSLSLDGGFFQDGFADCDNAGEKPIYNLATGAWTCGTDDDTPESGDFGAAADLEADGSLSANTVSADELDAAGVESELEAVLDHDDLQGFVANEHIDWTNATANFLTTGSMTGAYVTATSNITALGTLSGHSLVVGGDDVRINNVDYSFTGSQGAASTVLTNDGAGNLTWSAMAIGDGSGSFLSLNPEYPNAYYAGTGTTITGQLTASGTGLAGESYYRWSTTRTPAQRYQIVVRQQIPYNFDSWAAGTGMILQYRTDDASTANNYVQFKVWDTAGVLDHWSSQLATPNAANFSAARATPAELGGTYTPGQFMTVRITVMATTGNPADVGYLNFQWKTNTP